VGAQDHDQAAEALGVDVSRGAISAAKNHAAASGLSIRYLVGSGDDLPLPDNSVDCLVCVDVLEHVRDVHNVHNVDDVLDEIRRVLRPGGILLMYVPTIIQSHQIAETLHRESAWALVETFETLVRPWNIEGTSVRPFHSMVAHTGFLTHARLLVRDT
jgi:ubiquinone/menaquinone biosynthesis C-methylase UbiE